MYACTKISFIATKEGRKEDMQTSYKSSMHVFSPQWLCIHILALLLTLDQISRASTAQRSDQFRSYEQIPQPPIPSYPNGSGFARGSIDLGGLSVFEAQSFNKVWAIYQGGYVDSGVSFFEPVMLPEGYNLLGHFSQPRRKPIYASVLVAKDTTGDSQNGSLAKPIGFTLVWTSVGVTIAKDGEGYIWLPIAPTGYKAVGYIVTRTQDPPSVDVVRVVRKDFTALVEEDQWIWGIDNFNMHTTRPLTRGVSSHSIPVGTFMVMDSSRPAPIFGCLRRAQPNNSSMPNTDQVRALVEAYSPIVYFHADEQYFPSSVEWFFDNGALLYRNGQPEGEPVNPKNWNLPSTGTIDDYYIDLPSDDEARGRVKAGDLQSAKTYVQVRPAFAGTYTDLVVWLFYPFNGPAKFQVGPFTIKFNYLGEHVGDWEHLTLRVDNFNGGLKCVYVSEHGKGSWVNAMEMEYDPGNKPVVYASLHGHAFYSTPGHVIHSKELEMALANRKLDFGGKRWGFGSRNDTGKDGSVMDIRTQYEILHADTNSSTSGQPWLFYPGRWGPKISYDYDMLIDRATSWLPWFVKHAVRRILKSLPREMYGEEGPQGPMMKDCWSGDERV